ncbi:MarR family transcriptional regulator [Halomarina pelagica]|uniref:MarR family transcriptional regulator n=1 Tax=Halomarina pelagica TaxID=2961599 RepID=UPI0020C3A59F|nr:MarR family transcriptional regulator [Halomarina sp. BND7]
MAARDLRDASADGMRRHAEWMGKADDRILELLRADGPATPRALRDGMAARGTGTVYRRTDVERRCERLAAHGLIAFDGYGPCELTPLGDRYLRGDLDANELDRSDG